MKVFALFISIIIYSHSVEARSSGGLGSSELYMHPGVIFGLGSLIRNSEGNDQNSITSNINNIKMPTAKIDRVEEHNQEFRDLLALCFLAIFAVFMVVTKGFGVDSRTGGLQGAGTLKPKRYQR